MKSANLYAAMLGFTNSITFYAIAASFSLGAYLIKNNLFGMTFERIMLVFGCIIFGAQSVGQTSSLMPDYAKAKVAVVKMLELFEREPKINNWESTGGSILSEAEVDNSSGTIELKEVEFRYPSRPEARVLKKLSIQIKRGQRVALVVRTAHLLCIFANVAYRTVYLGAVCPCRTVTVWYGYPDRFLTNGF